MVQPCRAEPEPSCSLILAVLAERGGAVGGEHLAAAGLLGLECRQLAALERVQGPDGRLPSRNHADTSPPTGRRSQAHRSRGRRAARSPPITETPDPKPGTGAASIRKNDAAKQTPSTAASAPAPASTTPNPVKRSVERRLAKFAECTVSRKGATVSRAAAAAALGCSALVIGHVAPDARVTALLPQAGASMSIDKKTYTVS